MISNLFWCIIGIIGSIIVSYFFYFISQKRKILEYTISTKKIPYEFIKKHFNIQNNSKIFASEIVIQNSGNFVIENEDFVPSKPLKLQSFDRINGKLIYGMFITYINAKPGNIYLIFNNDENNATIHFECILPKEKIQFTIIHTGFTISINGKLKDGKIFNVEKL